MPVEADPHTSRCNRERAVELERYDRRPSTSRQASDLSAVFAPSKMVSPSLSAGIVKRSHLSRLRVNRFDPIELEAVACGTGQAEVFLSGCAAFGLR